MAEFREITKAAKLDNIPPGLLSELKDWYMKSPGDKDGSLFAGVRIIKKYGYIIAKPSRLREWCAQFFPEVPPAEFEESDTFLKLPVEKQLIKLALHKAIEAASYEKPTLNKILNLAKIVRDLITATATYERIELERNKANTRAIEILNKAKEEVLAEVQKRLSGQPDLMYRLIEVIEKATQKRSEYLDEEVAVN